MGLTHWKNAPKGAIRKTDVVIAKNLELFKLDLLSSDSNYFMPATVIVTGF